MKSKKWILLVLFYICFGMTLFIMITDKCEPNFLRAIIGIVSITGMITFGSLWMINTAK